MSSVQGCLLPRRVVEVESEPIRVLRFSALPRRIADESVVGGKYESHWPIFVSKFKWNNARVTVVDDGSSRPVIARGQDVAVAVVEPYVVVNSCRYGEAAN